MQQKTHRLVTGPSLNARYLADFMAASEQRRRTIIRDCKYRSTARMIQHIEAKTTLTNFIISGMVNPDGLLEKADAIQNKLTSDQFESDVNKHNADYVRRFYNIHDHISLPSCQIQMGGKPAVIGLEGVSIKFDPPIRLSRTTRTNKQKCGALMLRYQKGKPLALDVAEYQSAIVLGLLKLIHDQDMEEPDPAMCITLDAYSGLAHKAPSNATYLFNEVKAVCASIAERWAAIQPPKGAVL